MKMTPVSLCRTLWMSAAVLWLAMGSPWVVDSLSAAPRLVIKQEEGAWTWRDFYEREAAWMERVYLRPMEERLKGGPQAEEAADFVRQIINRLRLWPDERGWAPLLEQGDQLIASGQDDPLVVYLWAQLHFAKIKDWRACLARMQTAWGEIQLQEDPSALALYAGYFYRDLLREQKVHTRDVDGKLPTYMARALADGSFQQDEVFLFVYNTVRGWGSDHTEKNMEAVEPVIEASNLPEWAKLTITGSMEITKGWNERGRGYANTVTPEGWKGFARHLTGAEKKLRKAWELAPEYPYAAERMIPVVMGGHGQRGDTEFMWLERATRAHFDYMPAYRSTSWALRPRWGGSHQKMLALADACADTRRYDTYVPIYYFDTLDQIYSETKDWQTLYRNPAVAARVLEVSKGLVDAPERQFERAARQGVYALNAWMVGRNDIAVEQLAAAKGEFGPIAENKMRRYGIDPTEVGAELAMTQRTDLDDLQTADAMYSRREYAGALAAY